MKFLHVVMCNDLDCISECVCVGGGGGGGYRDE